jgi:DNA-binding SARP family transcriptional activator
LISVQILGQVSICAGTARSSANGSKMWTVATMLASHPNAFVSIDRLVDEVWEHDPPISAVANIRTYICGLRRILGPAASRITGQRTGYRLELKPSELDMIQFERLVCDGRRAFAGGDAAAGAASFRRALTLFPGPALVGVQPGEALTGVAGMLAEQRLSATDDLFAAELALGRHADLVGPLRRHVRAHPLRERCWGHLMVALYQCGDPAAALSAFAQARAVLITELGIEPGINLRSLQQAILRRSAELDVFQSPARPVQDAVSGTCDADSSTVTHFGATPVAPVSVAVPTPPCEVPRATQWFTGRTRHLAMIRHLIRNPGRTPPVIAVHGPPGAGTSTLVIRAALERTEDYPGGILYLDMSDGGGALTAEVAAGRLLATLDPATDGRRATAQLRSVLTARRALMVLDNVTSMSQVVPLLPASAGTALLIAGGRIFPALDAHHIGIGRFTATESHALLRAVVGPTRVDAEPLAAAAIAAACEHLALAVRVAAARLVAHPEWLIADLAQRLADEETRLAELSIDGLSVHDSLERQFRALATASDAVGARAGQALIALGRRDRATIALTEVATELSTSTRDAEVLLGRLVETNFLEVVGDARYRLPPLARAFTRQYVSDPSSGD